MNHKLKLKLTPNQVQGINGPQSPHNRKSTITPRFINSCVFAIIITLALLKGPSLCSAEYTIGMINTWSVAQGKVYYDAFQDGANAAIQYQNNNGKVRGDDLQIVFGNIDVLTDTSAAPLVNSIVTNYSSTLVCFALTTLDVVLASVVPAVAAKQYTLVGAIGRDSTLRSAFTKYISHLIPSPEAELLTQINYVMRKLRVKRVAMIISIVNDDPIEQTSMYPVYLLMKAKLAEYGVTDTYLVKLDIRTVPVNYSVATEVTNLLARKPQAVFYCAPPTNLGAQLLAFLMRLGSAQLYFGVFAVHGSLVEQVLAQIGSTVDIADRITATMPLPLYSASNPIAKAFRAEMAAATGLGLDVSANVGFRGQFAFLSWVHLKFTIAVMRSIDTDLPINKSTFTDALFNFRIQPVDDMFFGMYANDCTTFSGAACQCNQGGKFLWMSVFDRTATPQSIPNVLTTIATDDCDAADLLFKNPFIAAFVHPPTDNTYSDLMAGAQAFSVSSSDSFDLLPFNTSFTNNVSTEAGTIRTIVNDNVVGALFNPVTSSQDLFPVANVSTLVLEPIRLLPAPHVYNSRVIRIDATLDQEIHTATAYAHSIGSKLTLVLPDTIPSATAIKKLAAKSANTFGYEADLVMGGSTLQGALGGAALSGVLFVLGVASAADASSVVSFLVANSGVTAILPHEHVLLQYDALYTALALLPLPVKSRLFVTSSFGFWNSTDPEGTEAAFEAAQPTTRSPAALFGFVTQSFASRLLSQLSTKTITSELLVQALYSMTVISAAGGLVLGPYSSTACTSATADNCELSAGARSVSVLSFAQASGLVSGASAQTAYKQTYTSSKIAYTPLPPGPGPNIGAIVGGAIGGAAFLFIVLAVVLYAYSRYMKNAAAPVDATKPFALMFTDIQSSTTLWADIPEIMSQALTVHHMLIRGLIAKHKGYEVKTVGDCFMIAFKEPEDAVALAKELQVSFLEYDWGSSFIDTAYTEMDWELFAKDPVEYPKTCLSAFLPAEEYKKLWSGLRVRVGIHYDEGEIVLDPVSERYDYYGTVANVAARVEASAHGGQVVITDDVARALPITESCISLGNINLRGVPKPILLQQLICIPGRVFPPLRAISAEVDKSMSWQEHTSDSKSKSRDVVSNAASTVYTGIDSAGRQMVATVLKVLFAPFNNDQKRDQLQVFCTRWQLAVGGKVSKVDRATLLFESLVSRLGPIAQAKAKRLIPNMNPNEVGPVSLETSVSVEGLRTSQQL